MVTLNVVDVVLISIILTREFCPLFAMTVAPLFITIAGLL